MRFKEMTIHDDSGQGVLEYALILMFIAVVCIVSLNYFGQKNNNSLNNSASQLNNAMQ